MFTENANRAVSGESITPDNLEPNPKNPIIASFFSNIGLADELGSGVRNLYDTAKAGNACLVTGNLKHYPEESHISPPAQFVEMFEKQTRP